MSADLALSVITSSFVFCSVPHVLCVRETLKPCKRQRLCVFYTKELCLELLSYVILSSVADFK